MSEDKDKAESQPAQASAEEPPPTSTPKSAAEDALLAFEENQTAQAEARQPGVAGRILAWFSMMVRGFFSGFFKIKDEPTIWGRLFMALACLTSIGLLWYLATRPWYGQDGTERALDQFSLPSPEEAFGSFGQLWFDMALTRSLMASLWREFLGFGLAVLIGVPLGILSGAFRRVNSFFAPISMFGRNVPVVALVPLAMSLFGTGEKQKILFLFMACVAFIMFDAARAISEVRDDYLDTAYTLGASRWQTLTRVMIPIAAPDIFNSVRLLFGLAFGYIVLCETLVFPEYGAGKLLMLCMRRGDLKIHIPVILIFLTVMAFGIDRILFALQRVLFRYRYGSR